MASKHVTMRDIARALGVSVVTVSKALSGRDGVGEALREKIGQKARELGYQYDPAGKSAADRSKHEVGVLIPDRFFGANTFYASLYKKLILHLSNRGYYGILEILSERDEADMKLPGLLENSRVGAMVLIGQVSSAYIDRLVQVRVPYLFVDFYNERAGVEAIVSDSIYGSYLLTCHLIHAGHRDIGFIGKIDATSRIMDRYLGFYKGMIEHNLPVRPQWVLPDRDQRGLFIDVTLPDALPTAFVCNCDEVALRLIRRLSMAGKRVPQDISVVGFDDFLIASLSEPPLTTFRVDLDNMGRLAAEEIISKMSGRSRRNAPGILIRV